MPKPEHTAHMLKRSISETPSHSSILRDRAVCSLRSSMGGAEVLKAGRTPQCKYHLASLALQHMCSTVVAGPGLAPLQASPCQSWLTVLCCAVLCSAPLQPCQVRHLLLQQALGVRQVGAGQRLLPHAVQQRVQLVGRQYASGAC